MSEYGIWLSFNNQEEGFQLPVNPPAIDIGEKGKGKTYDIASGEINVIKTPELSRFGFASIFPATRYPFVTSTTLLPPERYVEYIKKWMETKRPIRFIFTGDTFDINTPASIEDFKYVEKAGSGDIEFQLVLKQFRFYTAKKVVIKKEEGPKVTAAKVSPPRLDDRPPQKTYKLVAGDSLWSVAQKILGNGNRYKEIQTLNNIKDSDLRRLPIGLELKLPAK